MWLTGSIAAFFVVAGVSRAASDTETRAIVDKWIATQQATSEVVFVQMKRWITPQAKPEELRFVVVHEQSGDGAMDYFLRVVRPADVQGVTLLVNQDSPENIKRYLFLPAVGKARELVGSARYQPLLGSDIAYAELEREVPSINSYERMEDVKVGSTDCYKIRARESGGGGESPYAYRDLYIDKESHRLQKVDFYDKADQVVKTLTASEYDSDEMGGSIKRPRRLQMKNNISGSMTELLVVEGRLDMDVPDEVFTPKRQETWQQWEVDNFIYDISEIVIKG